MLLAWQEGVNGLRDRRVYSIGDWPGGKVFEGFSDAPTARIDPISGRPLTPARWTVKNATEEVLNKFLRTRRNFVAKRRKTHFTIQRETSFYWYLCS